MQKVSNENEFDLHENEPLDGKLFQMNGFARRLDRFDTEAKNISETAYQGTDLVYE